MEDSDETVAAEEAALGLSPQVFVAEFIGIVADISDGAFEYSLQEAAAPGVLGAAKAAQKAAELERGLNAIRHVIMNPLDKRMTYWKEYCLQHCFKVLQNEPLLAHVLFSEAMLYFTFTSLPHLTNEYMYDLLFLGHDNSHAKESCKDGTSDSELDIKLDSLRRKLESANKDYENFWREMSSLERQTTYKRKLDLGQCSRVAESSFDHVSCDNIDNQIVNETKKAVWRLEDVDAFCTSCVELLDDDRMQPRRCLTDEVLESLSERVFSKIGKRYKEKQLIGKWNSLKKLYDLYCLHTIVKSKKIFRKKTKKAAKEFQNVEHCPPRNLELL